MTNLQKETQQAAKNYADEILGDQNEEWFKNIFTHWMPLPEPPKNIEL